MSEQNASSLARVFELLSRAERGEQVTVRDDQQDFPVFLDAARICRRRGGRFRLIDSGRFGLSELEWLAEAGADLYTSDEARTDLPELDLLARACQRGKSVAAFLHRGAIGDDSKRGVLSLGFLLDIARCGIDLHLTNREVGRDFDELGEIARVSRGAGAFGVYYHFGSLSEGLIRLARAGAWIHLSSVSIEGGGDDSLLSEAARLTASRGGGLVFHVERGLDVRLLRDLFKSGAYLVFKIPPGERGSLLRRLEDESRERRPSFRASYLFLDFLP